MAELQKTYIFADSDDGRERVIDELENYFKNMEIPDSIVTALNDSVNSIIDKGPNDTPNSEIDDYKNTSNVYELEFNLNKAIKNKMILLAQGKNPDLSLLDSAASFIDEHTGIQYWSAFVNNIKQYSPEDAVLWLRAKISAEFCKNYYDSYDKWKTALNYATLGLRALENSKDRRIKFDLTQRIQFILFNFYGYYELSIFLGERFLNSCKLIGYKLR
ncbi:MAG: hypothetical protein P8X42_14660, partial [Calditrichaceae bacterium]